MLAVLTPILWFVTREDLNLRSSDLDSLTGHLQFIEWSQTINVWDQFIEPKSKASTKTLQLDAQAMKEVSKTR